MNFTNVTDLATPDGDVVKIEDPNGNTLWEHDYSSLSGNPLTINNAHAGAFRNLKMEMEPIQDLNGYASAWRGGYGRNLLIPDTGRVDTSNGMTYTWNDDGSVSVSGTTTKTSIVRITLQDAGITAGNYYFAGLISAAVSEEHNFAINIFVWDYTTGTYCKKWDGTTNSEVCYGRALKEIQVLEGHNVVLSMRIQGAGITFNNFRLFLPCIRRSTDTNIEFEPYENECPISAHDGKVIEADQTTTTQHNINFGKDLYAGSLDMKTGELTETWSRYEMNGSTNILNVESLSTYGMTRFWFDVGTAIDTSEQFLCDCLPVNKAITGSDGSMVVVAGSSYPTYAIALLPTDLVGTTVASIQAHLADNPIHLLYKRATSVTTTISQSALDFEVSNPMTSIYTTDNTAETTFTAEVY